MDEHDYQVWQQAERDVGLPPRGPSGSAVDSQRQDMAATVRQRFKTLLAEARKRGEVVIQTHPAASKYWTPA